MKVFLMMMVAASVMAAGGDAPEENTSWLRIRVPDLKPRPPKDKVDALRIARDRAQPEKPEVTQVKTMRRPDRIVRSEIVDGRVFHHMESGATAVVPLRKAVTARVKSAPVNNDPWPMSEREREIMDKDGSVIRGIPAIDPELFPGAGASGKTPADKSAHK